MIDITDPSSIQEVCHIWTSLGPLLTMESLWLNGKASECGFLLETQNFFPLSNAPDLMKNIFL